MTQDISDLERVYRLTQFPSISDIIRYKVENGVAVFMRDSQHVTILGIFDKKAKYKDFERIFKKLRK